MILISGRKKWRLCKLIAEAKHIATYSIWETDRKTQADNATRTVKALADIAHEIGGSSFAGIDVVACEYELQEKMKKGEKQ